MNNLTNCIISHIFDNLGLTADTKVSLKDKFFALNQTINVVDENGDDTKALLYGSEVTIHSSKFRIIVADFSNQNLEYALIVKLDSCPSYACYLLTDFKTKEPQNGMLCFSLNPNSWLMSNTSIQGTFLSGMENLKDITGAWEKLTNFDDLVEELKSFIDYQDNFYEIESGDDDEG